LRWSPKPGPGSLACRVGLGFEFVGELIELVEIDSGPEPERVRIIETSGSVEETQARVQQVVTAFLESQVG